ncbi:nucleolar and coiled-body phosphoprotein 1 [Neocloeon triangulifer]|uniref:nucleolar and coiled-body phosphoprotein 1 n=1 Tax=Neocloeon triangulifer TaxID=2078957 RepID=UPI00286F0049|nr:nucleolar and coiled-body phosphoprotein 1 [Neocloeon triangulifer]
MSPPRTVSSARPSLSRQASETAEAPAPVRRPLLRRQRSADDDRPITQLLHSALKVTASALGPGILADQSPPPPPKPSKGGPLRPVRVAWAELRGREPPLQSPKSPTCLPALARANIDIFLAHSGLAQCLANIDLGRQSPKPVEPMKVSPREAPIKAALTPIPRTPTLATSRRVNFKSASKTVNRSFNNESPEPQKLTVPFTEPRNARILSAPAHRTAPILTPPRPMLRSLPRRSPLNSSFESETSTDTRTKSATSKRRLKSAGRSSGRRSGGLRKGDDTSDDDACEESPSALAQHARPLVLGVTPPPKVGRRGLQFGAEIVTMVSLISPAHSSDSESETSPGAHQVVPVPSLPEAAPAWQDEKSERPRNPPLAIVCARKINKSVSFQSRSSLPELLRRASIQLVTPPTKSEKEEEGRAKEADEAAISKKPVEASITAAGNKEATKVEIPTAPPANGIMKAPKRKVVRAKSLSRQNSKNESTETSKETSVDSQSSNSIDSVIKKEPDKPKEVVTTYYTAPVSILKAPKAPLASAEEIDPTLIEGSPKFESPKEQECWHLYRKMCEKGLTVSFDTVLRGMLTPTEYRLRKSALLSSC